MSSRPDGRPYTLEELRAELDAAFDERADLVREQRDIEAPLAELKERKKANLARIVAAEAAIANASYDDRAQTVGG